MATGILQLDSARVGDRAGLRAVLAVLPAGLLAISLGLGKVVRDCALTCNVGFELVPAAILGIAALALPLQALRVWAEDRFGPRAWHLGSVLLAAASLLGFRLLAGLVLARRESLVFCDDPAEIAFWAGLQRALYLAFFVWVGALAALLGGNAFAHLFRLHPPPERPAALARVALAIVVGGVLGSALAGQGAARLLAPGLRYEVVRDNLMLLMAAVLLLQVPVLLAIDRLAAPAEPVRSAAATSRGSLLTLWTDPTLRRLALVVFWGGFADTLLKYVFYWLVSAQTVPSPATGRTLDFATFYVWLNGASLLMLAFGTSRVLQRLGLGAALLSLPLAVVLGAASLAVNAVLAVMYLLRVVEGALRSTLYEPGLERAYLVLGDRASEARSALNGLVARLGEGAGAIAVLTLTFGARLPLRAMTVVLLGSLLLWLASVLTVRRTLELQVT